MKSIKLKVELCGVKSVRHVVVPENITLVTLHEVIQALFAWENEHLWGFRASNGTLWEFQSDDEATIFRPPAHSPDETCVGTVFPKKGAHLEYTYDFGDNWLHRIMRMTDPKEGGCLCATKKELQDYKFDNQPNPKKDDSVHNPAHYCGDRKYQPWDVIMDWDLDFLLGNAVKYIARAGRKQQAGMTMRQSEEQDLQKAIEYLQKRLDIMRGKNE